MKQNALKLAWSNGANASHRATRAPHGAELHRLHHSAGIAFADDTRCGHIHFRRDRYHEADALAAIRSREHPAWSRMRVEAFILEKREWR